MHLVVWLYGRSVCASYPCWITPFMPRSGFFFYSWLPCILHLCRMCEYHSNMRWVKCQVKDCQCIQTQVDQSVHSLSFAADDWRVIDLVPLQPQRLYAITRTLIICGHHLENNQCKKCGKYDRILESVCSTPDHRYCQSCLKQLPPLLSISREAGFCANYNERAATKEWTPSCWQCVDLSVNPIDAWGMKTQAIECFLMLMKAKISLFFHGDLLDIILSYYFSGEAKLSCCEADSDTCNSFLCFFLCLTRSFV